MAAASGHFLLVWGIYVLFFLPMWIALPAMNEYIIARRCLAMRGVFATTGPVCGSDDVSVSAQNWSTWTMLSCNLPSLFVVLPLGRLADLLGRRSILLWCLATQVFGSAGMLAVCLFELDLVWMMPSFFINGLGGGSYTLQNLLMASLVDVSASRQQQAKLLALMTASYYACGCIGPLSGGYISAMNVSVLPALGGAQYQMAYVLFFVTNALVLVLAVAMFNETLEAAPPSSDDPAASPVFSFFSFRQVLGDAVEPLRRSQDIRTVSLVFLFLYSTINVGLSGLVVTYAKLDIFDMSDETVGWFLGVPWLVRAFSAAVIFPALLGTWTHYRGSDDVSIRAGSIIIVRVGATISCVIFALFGLATTSTTLFVLCSVEGLAAMWDSACSVLLSSLSQRDGCTATGELAGSSKSNQGGILGLRALLQTSMACVGPFVFNAVYAETLHWMMPFVFYMLGVCCAIALALSFRYGRARGGAMIAGRTSSSYSRLSEDGAR